MVATQQPGENEQFKPGSYLSPLSSAAMLFAADTSRALWKVAKPGIPKGLVGTRVPKGVRGMGSLLVALLTAQSSQRNTFWVWLMLPQASTLCGCGLLWRCRYVIQIGDRMGRTAEQNQVWKMKYSDLLQSTHLPTRANFKTFI